MPSKWLPCTYSNTTYKQPELAVALDCIDLALALKLNTLPRLISAISANNYLEVYVNEICVRSLGFQ